ncbi:MAG TPA: LPS export ABC transporter periplasmic protein LptC [Steroidobacteraceae bacterium]|nr:LPS export ABC transporter periplasmic protein LptC [Steroidobacteraceae bacterium]
MKALTWSRPVAYIAVIGTVAAAYFIGRAGRGVNGVDDSALNTPDPGYAAKDAEIIETGYDGRERYRLSAKHIRQKTEAGVIELETLAMNYHPDAQERIAGETPSAAADQEIWHLTSDHGLVRADGDDVQLNGNVRVTGPAPGSGVPLSLTTSELRINTPTEFIETKAPVKVILSGNELNAKGLTADLKAGTLRLESEVHGQFAQK